MALAFNASVRLRVTVSVWVTPVVAKYSTSKTNWFLVANRKGPSNTKSPAASNRTKDASAPDKVKVGLTGAIGSAATCVCKLVKSSISMVMLLPGRITSSDSKVIAPVVSTGTGGAEEITVMSSIYRLAPNARPNVLSNEPATKTYL